MREGGVEPPRPYGHTDLNRARLPIPPLARDPGGPGHSGKDTGGNSTPPNRGAGAGNADRQAPKDDLDLRVVSQHSGPATDRSGAYLAWYVGMAGRVEADAATPVELAQT